MGSSEIGLRDFFSKTEDSGTKQQNSARPLADFDQILSSEGADHLKPVIQAIYKQESGSGSNSKTSTNGARGGMQIMPDTFKRYAKAGESINNPDDNMRVGVRIIKDLGNKFGDDPAKIATGYFSGEGNVSNDQGRAFKKDHADANGKRVSSYVSDVLSSLGMVSNANAGELPKADKPDLDKAPKWLDIITDPEFIKLSQDQQSQAKQAYFDHYIKPHAGSNSDALFKQFMDAPNVPRDRTWGEALSDTGAQLAEGVNNIAGAIPNLISPEGSVAEFFNNNSKFWQDKQSDPLKAKITLADAAIKAADQDGVVAQISEAAGQYFSDPALAARFIVTNLPSMIPGIAAAKVAHAAALARGASAAKAGSVATTAAGLTGAALNAGGARGDAFNDIKDTLIKQGMSPDQAEEAALKDSRISAAVGGLAGYVAGKTGLEKSLFGEGTAKNVLKAGAAGAAAELGGEQLEEVAPKLTTNLVAQGYDNRSAGQDVGRTIVETGIASGPGSVFAGGVSASNALKQQDRPQEEIQPQEAGVDADQSAPTEPVAQAVADPKSDSIEHPTVQTANDIVRDLAQQAGIPEEVVLPKSPLSPGAVQKSAEQSSDTNNVIQDSDVLNFAQGRYQQLIEKRDGHIQSGIGDNGITDQHVAGSGLDQQEQQELDALESLRGNVGGLKDLYGLNDQQQRAENPNLVKNAPVSERSDDDLRQQMRDSNDRSVRNAIAEELLRREKAATDNMQTVADEQKQKDQSASAISNTTKTQEPLSPSSDGHEHIANELNSAAHEAATSPENDRPEPSEAQKQAGNYKKGHINFDGLDISIENPAGSKRSGVDHNGKPWSVGMTAHYGYLKRSEGADGDQVDVYVPSNPVPDSPVYVFDQFNRDGKFDEHKAVVGVRTQAEAQQIYDAHFSDGSGPQRRRGVTAMSAGDFKQWAQSGNTKNPLSKPKTEREAKERRKPIKADASQGEPVTQKTVTKHKTEKEVKAQRRAKQKENKNVTKTTETKQIEAPGEEKDATLGKNLNEDSPSAAARFSKNKIFTEDKVAAARERLKSKLNTLNSGIDPEILQDGMTLAGAYIESGMRTFGEYSDAMIQDLGEKVRPYLRSFYEAVRHHPGFDSTGMTDAAEIDAMGESSGATVTKKPENSNTNDESSGGIGEELSGGKSDKKKNTDNKIEDFGEKIGGARKDVWSNYKNAITDSLNADIATNPLSKSWPEPDYQSLLKNRADPFAIAFAHAARDEIPTKPEKPYKLTRWIEQVKSLRDITYKLISNELSLSNEQVKEKFRNVGSLKRTSERIELHEFNDRVKEKLRNLSYENYQKIISDKIELYKVVGHSKSLKGVTISEGHYSVYQGIHYSPAKKIWSIEKSAKATAFRNWPTILASGDTRDEAISHFKEKYSSLEINKPASKEIEFDIYRYKHKPGWFIGKKIGKSRVDLAEFEELKDARKFKLENQDELVSRLEKFKEIPSERRDTNTPRVGVDHRNGENVTPQMFQQTFGFRGVEFGNYVENDKRHSDLNEAYDALMDMAGVLNIPAKSLSLNGELGLAFGARGKGGKNPAKAHYEPGFVVINLTKNNGPGSIGHEWWHALDNYFSRMRNKKDGFMTTSLDVSIASRDGDLLANTEVRKEMIQAFGDVVKAIRKTTIKARSSNLDAKRTKSYWSTGEEMSARAFESYLISKLQDQNASNDYLANIVDEDTWEAAEKLGFDLNDTYPYPTAGEIPQIRAAFDHFFDTVEHKETEKGLQLFTLSDADPIPESDWLSIGNFAQVVEDRIGDFSHQPPVIIMDSVTDIPGMRQASAGSVAGLTTGGKIYIFRDANATTADITQTLWHELLHYGIRRFLTKEQYITATQRLYDRDLWVKAKAEAWIATDAADVKQAKKQGMAYVRARGVDEALAELAEINAGEYLNNTLLSRAIRNILRWITELADKFGFHKFAAKYRAVGNDDARELIKSVFTKLRENAPATSTDKSFKASSAFKASKTAEETQNNLFDFFGSGNKVSEEKSPKNFGLYHKTLSTQYHKALKDKHYGKVFSLANAMQNQVSLASIRPAELAPGVLPRVDDFKSAAKGLFKGAENRKHLKKVADAIFAGTLAGEGAADGRVWNDTELKNVFGMDPAGIALYRQARAAIDASIDELAAAEGYAMAQNIVPKDMRRMIVDEPALAGELLKSEAERQINVIGMAIRNAKSRGDDQSAAKLETLHDAYSDTREKLNTIFDTAKNLKKGGYAPLMRFGKWTVSARGTDENGEQETLYFAKFDTEGESRAALSRIKEKYKDRDDIRFESGIDSQDSHELFAGISPETVALFGDAIGAGEVANKYYQIALSERSALKRRLERKGTPGYSDDLPRVLSNFITSNGRFSAQRYYLRDLNESIRTIPQNKGDVKDEAIKLKQFIVNPGDPAAPLSTVMFAWFLGGSVAAAAVNMTQPVMMTGPYLSQFGVASAGKELTKAIPYAMGKKEISDRNLRDALQRASREGVVDAQEIFHLYSMGAQSIASGLIGTLSRIPGAGKAIKAGGDNARARINAFLTLWGSMFSLAEKFNRKLTFIAAWNMAIANGDNNPYAFAVRAVNETQGIYAKVNRPNWARNPAGRVILTFKQYSLTYIELLSRMWKRGGPEGKRAALIMLAVLMLAAGEEGLPFAQDLDDLIDTIGQLFGLDTNMRRNKREAAYSILGNELGDMFLYGISSQLPLDVSGRLGLGNFIPGTGLLKKSDEQMRTRNAIELLGPAAGMGSQLGDAYDAATEGNSGKALQNLAPKAIKDILAAEEMVRKGYSSDFKGRKVTDVGLSDAAIKATGFNPTKIAQVHRKTMPLQQDISLQKITETSIANQWARGIRENDQKMIDEAKQRQDDWNKKNPGIPIAINGNQLRDRVRSLTTDKNTRLLKDAPKEMRGRIGLELLQ